VIAAMDAAMGDDKPILVGHSVGGLVAQILLNRGRISAAVAISSVAPNAMLDLDWGMIKNAAIIANPLKGDEPVLMDAKTFHGAFANSLSAEQAAAAFERTATHDSRNVFRDCMGEDGKVDLAKPHGPLLLIGGEKDEIIPADLCRKNAQAYDDPAGFREFKGRSHYICGEPGWQEVAETVAGWLDAETVRTTGGGATISTTQALGY
jgi:pimeloyl-ACP methyl ester carboxylesterase